MVIILQSGASIQGFAVFKWIKQVPSRTLEIDSSVLSMGSGACTTVLCAETDASWWVMHPNKQEILKNEAMKLLQDKVIKPFSGESQMAFLIASVRLSN